MKNDLLLAIFEHKYATLVTVALGSKVMNDFITNSDWGYTFFGLVGFAFMWALDNVVRKKGDVPEEEKKRSAKYWVSKLILSLFLPLFFVDPIKEIVNINEMAIAAFIGAVPDLVAIALIDKGKGFIKNWLKDDGEQ